MELDPIVILAYVSVAANIITVIAAAVAYAVFRIRRRRHQRAIIDGPAQSTQFEPVFLRPYLPSVFVGGNTTAEGENDNAPTTC